MFAFFVHVFPEILAKCPTAVTHKECQLPGAKFWNCYLAASIIFGSILFSIIWKREKLQKSRENEEENVEKRVSSCQIINS